MSDSDELKNIDMIKKEKKLKKALSPEVIEIRRNNLKKARDVKDDLVKNKNKIKLLEHNISNFVNYNDSDSDENTIINLKKKKIIDKDIITPEKQTNNNDYKILMDSIYNINKKVEKLYIMKKNKPVKQPTQPMPVYVNTKNDKSDDLLNAIRNKMLNN